jgi:nucleoside-diphosphate-sugar epimerase
MRILVTGGQGCIGSWVIKRLLDRGIDVLMYDMEPNPLRLSLIASPEAVSRVAIKTGRIEDTAAVKQLVKNEGVTHIVHLAAVLMPFCQANPVAGGLVNVIGTLNLFEAARDAGRPVRIVYASSSAVWGPSDAYEDRPLSEEDPLKPSTHYGVFKQANEGNARIFYAANGISSIGLRPWTVYGAGRDTGLTADPSLAIRSLVLEEPFQIRLSGFMDLQYVEDVAETFICCLLSPLEGAHVFNLAGEVISMDQFISTLEHVRPGASALISASGPQVPVAFQMDDSQLRQKISGIGKTPLRDGIEKTFTIFQRLRTEGRLTI